MLIFKYKLIMCQKYCKVVCTTLFFIVIYELVQQARVLNCTMLEKLALKNTLAYWGHLYVRRKYIVVNTAIGVHVTKRFFFVTDEEAE